MVVHIKTDISGYTTASHGDELRTLMLPSLQNGEAVTVSFDGVTTTSSSFVNSAFVPLLADIGYARVRQLVSFTGINHAIASLIKKRMEQESHNFALPA